MWYVDLRYKEYSWTLDLQYKLRAARQEGKIPDILILVEHPPVITLGSAADEKHVLVNSAQLTGDGIGLYKTNRGGDVTYHGPGQLVGYPIIDLRDQHRDMHLYLRNIEEMLIRTLEIFHLKGSRKKGYPGVWIGNRKVAAIGIAISRWVTMHGFALNVSTNLKHFSFIVPCGISQFGVTSLVEELSSDVDMAIVKKEVIKSFSNIFSKEDMEEYPEHALLELLNVSRVI